MQGGTWCRVTRCTTPRVGVYGVTPTCRVGVTLARSARVSTVTRVIPINTINIRVDIINTNSIINTIIYITGSNIIRVIINIKSSSTRVITNKFTNNNTTNSNNLVAVSRPLRAGSAPAAA